MTKSARNFGDDTANWELSSSLIALFITLSPCEVEVVTVIVVTIFKMFVEIPVRSLA